MVQPEFKPFSFTVSGTDKFSVLANGKKYLDFTGSAMTTGYDFIEKEWITSPVSRLVFKNEYTDELKERLLKRTGFDNIAFTTSGTEACDAALSREVKAYLSFEGAYHGLTYLTRLVSNGIGIDRKNKIIHLKFPSFSISDDDAISTNERLIKDSLKSFKIDGGSLIIELIQSDGGVNVASKRFIDHVTEIANQYNLTLIIDEVYTAYGRSGEMFLFKKYNLNPDMVCIGKGMAAGLPLGALLYKGEWKVPHNDVLSMQSANMFTAKVALEVINRLEQRKLEWVQNKGNSILKELKKIKNKKIREVRGLGFMIGVEMRSTLDAYKLRDDLESKGVLCSLVGERNNVLKITPPPLIDPRNLNNGISKIISSLKSL